jgi:hypothetical protein
MLLLSACADMFENVKDFATDETVYPGKFDTIFCNIGFERAEIDLMKVGRIPASQINMGKSSKTVIQYDDKEMRFDSVCSWVNITNLTQSKLYRIKAFTEDEFGNRSVPQETSLIPFTKSDLEILTVATPRVIASPWAVSLSWSNLSSVLLNYCDMSFTYSDKDGKKVTGTRAENPLIIMENLNAGEEASINLTYRVVPKVSGVEILDTVLLDKTFYMYMPTSDAFQKALESRSVKSLVLSPSQDIKLTFNPVDNHTLLYSTIKYLDTSSDVAMPVLRTVRVENDETVVTVPGMRIGSPFSISSTYKPDGVEGVFIDSDFRQYNPESIDYDRSTWTATTTHNWASDSQGPGAILDENYASFLSLAKPGKSVNGSSVPAAERAGFIIDCKETANIDYFRILHRNTTVGLRIWKVAIYGSPDNTNWEAINEDYTVTGYNVSATQSSPNLSIPHSGFRYIKVLITGWDAVNNSATQLSEFYLGMSAKPVIN